MMPSKLIQFFNGTPPDEKKKEIERRMTNKFSGAENGGKFFIVFNDKKDHEIKIDDLSGSELDKMFQELDKTVQGNIFSGHGVTSTTIRPFTPLCSLVFLCFAHRYRSCMCKSDAVEQLRLFL